MNKCGWVSLYKAKPEEYTQVMVCDAYAICQDMREPFMAHQEKGVWYWNHPFSFVKGRKVPKNWTISHWMEVPENPEIM